MIKNLRIAISAVAMIAVAAHLIWPALAIDHISLLLLAIALVPWLAPLFESMEFPGGLKVEFRDLQEAGKKAEEVGLVDPEVAVSEEGYSFEMLAREDPNLALASLRIEIEKCLVMLVDRESSSRPLGIHALLRMLDSKGVLGKSEIAAVKEIIQTLNAAVHGAEVDQRSAEWALEFGPRLLASLTAKIG